jgi:hypothetical protein
MKSSVSPMLATVRQELEERRRLRLERAQGRYQAATVQYRRSDLAVHGKVQDEQMIGSKRDIRC